MNKYMENDDDVKESLVVRIGLAIMGVCQTVLFSLFASMMVAESLEGDTAAINVSASLRTQSYRIINTWMLMGSSDALSDEIYKFEQILSEPLLKFSIYSSGEELVVSAAESVRSSWFNILKPALQNPDLKNERADNLELLALTEAHVNNIDVFVKALETNSESKVKLLRAIQGGSFFVVFFIASILMYRVYGNMVQPLRDIVAAAQKIKRGDFSTKVHYDAPDELGLLAKTFNQMGDELDSWHQNLEERVAGKTAELQRSNDSLRILYESSRTLYADPKNTTLHLRGILESLQETTNQGTITLCLSKSKEFPAYQLITSDDSERPSFCKFPDCNQCAIRTRQHNAISLEFDIVKFPIVVGDIQHGELNVEIAKEHHLDEWQRHLFNAIADIIGTTLTLSNLGEKEARLALMEERSVIARELHDSLAQSLSYQKIQAFRLKKLLESSADPEQVFTAITEIQNGINAAYKQLRELLTTFRAHIDAPGLESAIVGTVADFHEHSDVQIELDYHIAHCPLTPNEEIHCLQIIREALSNVVKHAGASTATIRLCEDGDRNIIVEVLDDGIGISDPLAKHHHFGLSILSERSKILHGSIKVSLRPEGGTSVKLNFPPRYLVRANVSIERTL
ncbi:MAG: HAMP domain-containing protein [Pseudomonadales bacterium]|nr:HAMP domain-containing protein [Pseudomonadales bacterium]